MILNLALEGPCCRIFIHTRSMPGCTLAWQVKPSMKLRSGIERRFRVCRAAPPPDGPIACCSGEGSVRKAELLAEDEDTAAPSAESVRLLR